MVESSVENHVRELVDLLSNPLASSIFKIHPNDIGGRLSEHLDDERSHAAAPNEWKQWWDWAGHTIDGWKALIEANNEILRTNPAEIERHNKLLCDIPEGLLQLLRDSSRLAVPRSSETMNLFSTQEQSLLDTYNNPKDFAISVATRHEAESRTTHRTKRHIGMSSKKEHEVARMSTYILQLLRKLSIALQHDVRHVIDIGAGQGYLSRSLRELECSSVSQARKESQNGFHVLALDSSAHQTEGAERRTVKYRSFSAGTTKISSRNPISLVSKNSNDGTLTFRTMWLGNDPTLQSHPGNFSQGSVHRPQYELENTIDDWVSSLPQLTSNGRIPQDVQEEKMIPVVFTALHACGSLTPTILRHALSFRRPNAPSKPFERRWHVAAVVVVGCCYNLLEPQDFPLSHFVKSYIENRPSNLVFPYGCLQLAAQVPTQWLRDPETTAKTKLAIKKVLYRALITSELTSADGGDEDSNLPANPEEVKTRRRLGKLNDKLYADFNTFLDAAGTKTGSNFAKLRELQDSRDNTNVKLVETSFARRIEVLHTLRCILGPPLESLVILDRFLWLKESLADSHGIAPRMDVDVVNLFDQGMDSGRNIALSLYESTI